MAFIAVTDRAVRDVKLRSVHNCRGRELRGGGEEAGRVCADQKQIEMRDRHGKNDRGQSQRRPTHVAPNQGSPHDLYKIVR
jgi:hypothetical protein